MSGGASLAGEGLRKALKGTAEEQQAAMSRYLGNIASATGGLVKSVGTVGQAAGVLGNMVPAEFQRISRIMQAGGLTFEQAMKKAAEDSAKAAKGPAGAFAEAQQNVKRFGSNMNEVFMKLIGPLVEPLVKFSGGLLESINTLISSDGFAAVVDKVTKTMTKMIEWAGGAFKKISDAFGDGDWKKAFSEAFKQLKEGLGNIWEVIKPTMVELWNTVLKPAFVGLLDLMWGAFKEWLFGPSAQQLQDQGQQKKEQKVAVRVDEAYYKNQATEQLAGKEGVTTIQINELAKKLKEQAIAENEAEMRRLNARNQAQPPVRHSGTIGMTGNWWEKKDATLAVQAGESVVTKSQMDQIINTASQTGMAESIQQLNSLTAQMLAVMKQTADNTKRTYDATRALNGDLFQVA
jgi:hypothetical protein